MTTSPFDHRPDPKVGAVLREALTAPEEEAFVQRVLARVAEQDLRGDTGVPWWEVLSEWARPGLVAACVGLVVAVAVWFGALGHNSAPVALGDPLQAAESSSVAAAFLAAAGPPNLDEVLALSLGN